VIIVTSIKSRHNDGARAAAADSAINHTVAQFVVVVAAPTQDLPIVSYAAAVPTTGDQSGEVIGSGNIDWCRTDDRRSGVAKCLRKVVPPARGNSLDQQTAVFFTHGQFV
jgi:hypothetical protein